MSTNVRAFLDTISHSEGTDMRPDPYRVTFGYNYSIKDLADHPAITGEWMGESYGAGWSTAAGKYQIIKPTWIALKAALKLPDFSPESQDAAATELVRQRGALSFVEAGDIQFAVNLCAKEWASLPGSVAGQPTRSLGSLIRYYASNGGTFMANGGAVA